MDVALISFGSPLQAALEARFKARGRSCVAISPSEIECISSPLVIDCTALESAQGLASGDIDYGVLWQQAVANNSICVMLSDGRVFDGVEGGRHLEEDQAGTQADGAKSLLAAEQILVSSGKGYVILRTSALFGSNEGGYLARLVSAVANGDKQSLDDSLRFAPTSFADIARVISGLADQLLTGAEGRGIFHYQSEDTTTSFGFAEIVAAHLSQHRDLPGVAPNFELGEKFATVPMIPTLGCERILYEFGIKQLPWRRYMLDAVKELNVGIEA